MSKTRAFLFAVVAALACSLAPTPVSAQTTFPTRPVRLVVPLAPGGGGDIVARLVAAKMQDLLGQQMIVENRAGGATVPGTDFVAKSAPDGYTLLLATSSHVVNGSLHKLPFDPVKDFSAVTLLATSPLILVVNPKVPATTLAELIALAKAKPDSLNYASSGTASLTHISGELLNRMAGIAIVHVPYKGSGPAETDLLGGQVQMFFASTASAAQYISAGRLRAIAITTARRSPAFPDVPAVAETLPGFETGSFYSVLAPAGTPQSTIDRLHAAFVKALAMPDVKERLQSIGAEIVGAPAAENMAYIQAQIRQWDKVIKEAGIKAD